MKAIKKIVTLALVAMMTIGMSMTAFAEETTNVTVNLTNVAKDATVKVGAILKADTTSTLGYSFATENTHNYEVSDLIKLGEAQKDNADETADLTNGVATNSSEIAAAAEAFSDVATETVENNTISFTTAGLYVITVNDSTNQSVYTPMLVYVKSGDTATYTYKAKGSSIVINKVLTTEDEGKSVYGSEEVGYTITVPYPFFGENTDTLVEIKDTLTNASYKEGSVVVKVGDAEVSSDDVTTTIDGTNLTVKFNDYDQTLAGKTISVTYTAIASTETTYTTMDNEAQIVKLTGSDHKTETLLSAAKVVVPTTKATVKKVDYSDSTKVLEGATFAIYNEEDVTDGKINDGASPITTAVTNEDGIATFTNLDVTKNYYVVETIAPTGYSLNDTVYTLEAGEVSVETATAQDENNATITTTTYSIKTDINSAEAEVVTDTTLSALPFTGGIGTTIFTIAGVVIMVLAAALYFATKKKAANN